MTGIIKKLRAALVKYQTPSSSPLDGDSRNKMPVQQDSLNNTPKKLLLTLLIASVGATTLVVMARNLGVLQSTELIMYDGMMRSRQQNLKPDSRILLVEITQDYVNQHPYPLKDETINEFLKKLQSYQPRIVALNMYRPNQNNLGSGLTEKQKDNIVATCALGNNQKPYKAEIPPPRNLPKENFGFNDFISDDSDRIVRRSLFSAKPDPNTKCNSSYSFAALAALNYLEEQNIHLDVTKSKKFKVGNVIIPPLTSNSGSYENIDAGGYQILINYRYPDALAKKVSITQVLNNQVNPQWIKDKLVIVGATADSAEMSGGRYTPYSASSTQPIVTPSLYIHAHIASQILSAVLDATPLIWYWQNWAENLWIWSWAVVGSILVLRNRHPYFVLLTEGIAVFVLLGIGYIIFLQGGWIPILPPAIALVMSSIGVIAYTAYHTQQQTKIIIIQVEKQQEAIAQLSALLKETRIQDTYSHSLPVVDIPEKQTGDFLLGGRYQITRVLGSGGFGCTYLAKDTQRPNQPNCVVKQLMPARRDPKFLEVARRLFDTEAEILQVLGKHHQIPDLLAYFEEGQEFYLVQEYIQGNLLSEELPPTHQIQNQKFVIELLQDILKVLSFVHSHRVIHRDLKPSNIIRNSQTNRLVLIDFGAVKTMQPQNEKTELATVAIGTKGYAPPEQLAGHPRLCSDIYALGMIAIQSLTGIPAYALQVNLETGTVEWQNACDVRADLAKILNKMVLYHFSDRYQTANEVLEDLNKLVI